MIHDGDSDSLAIHEPLRDELLGVLPDCGVAVQQVDEDDEGGAGLDLLAVDHGILLEVAPDDWHRGVEPEGLLDAAVQVLHPGQLVRRDVGLHVLAKDLLLLSVDFFQNLF